MEFVWLIHDKTDSISWYDCIRCRFRALPTWIDTTEKLWNNNFSKLELKRIISSWLLWIHRLHLYIAISILTFAICYLLCPLWPSPYFLCANDASSGSDHILTLLCETFVDLAFDRSLFAVVHFDRSLCAFSLVGLFICLFLGFDWIESLWYISVLVTANSLGQFPVSTFFVIIVFISQIPPVAYLVFVNILVLIVESVVDSLPKRSYYTVEICSGKSLAPTRHEAAPRQLLSISRRFTPPRPIKFGWKLVIVFIIAVNSCSLISIAIPVFICLIFPGCSCSCSVPLVLVSLTPGNATLPAVICFLGERNVANLFNQLKQHHYTLKIHFSLFICVSISRYSSWKFDIPRSNEKSQKKAPPHRHHVFFSPGLLRYSHSNYHYHWIARERNNGKHQVTESDGENRPKSRRKTDTIQIIRYTNCNRAGYGEINIAKGETCKK